MLLYATCAFSQHGFEAITCKTSLWIAASWVLMWTSPTWPFSYLRKKRETWNIDSLQRVGGLPVCCFIFTHTKRKRVHTLSDIGHTQMFPCFWRSFEVMTVGDKKQCHTLILTNQSSLLHYIFLIYLHRAQCSSGCCSAETWLVPALPKTKTRTGLESNKRRCWCSRSKWTRSLNKCEG